MKNRLSRVFAILLFSGSALAAAPAYDQTADAKTEVQQALATAESAKLPVLLIFGANWCGDCRALDASLKTKKNAELVAKTFLVVKVDVGNFNKNLDVASAYGDPIKKGIPAAVILSSKNKILYTTQAGELANARRMSDAGIYDFFKRAAASVDDNK